jgi:hypothetical protein
MREFSGSPGSDALYQGTTVVGPLRPNKDEGFESGRDCSRSVEGLTKMRALYQGTTSRPHKPSKDEGFSP